MMTKMKLSCRVSLLLAAATVLLVQAEDAAPVLPTTDCSLEAYYSEFTGLPVTQWSREALADLITRTHEISLVKLATKEEQVDVYTALKDVDAGNSSTADEPMVHLYMRDIDFPATLRTPEGWTRGDLWPTTKTADPDTTQAGTDIHAKRPEDWEVERELRGLFWGTCGLHEADETRCVTPAVPTQTAADTATDFKIKTPPEHLRGDVARSLLYLELRYNAELGLAVTDCPPFAANEIGYRSELLQWHRDDPPSAPEQERNQRVCERWQGNRNPLVDHPDLVERLFGVPDTIVPGLFQYQNCTAPTASPTASPNECSELLPGDVSVIIWNSDPEDQLVLFPVSRIPEGVGSIFVTDQPWDGTQFVHTDQEGTLEVSSRLDEMMGR